jgi:hypothetical protein
MSTARQDNNFSSLMEDLLETKVTVSGLALESAIDFISSEFEPEDIFTEKQLTDWAERNGFIKE